MLALREPDQIYCEKQENRYGGAGQRVTSGKETGDSFTSSIFLTKKWALGSLLTRALKSV
jgi:uncharacterized protein YhjY with autotransporter beta-barrel domain